MTGVSRRRFLCIAACAALMPSSAQADRVRWRGRAFGAEAEITLLGVPRHEAEAIFGAARDVINRIERMFSLYRSDSLLVGLNRTGRLYALPAEFSLLLREAERVVQASGGSFDPTIQPLWQLHAKTQGHPTEREVARAQALVGWDKVVWDERSIELTQPGMALSFNGIAQGFATDRVTQLLHAHGLHRVLVNMGEFRALGGPWRLGAGDETLTITDQAVASSAVDALQFGQSGRGHILDAARPAVPVSEAAITVVADTATRADGASTALCACAPTRRERLAEALNVTWFPT